MKLPTDQDILGWLAQFAPQKAPGSVQLPGLLEPTALPMQALPQGARVMDSGEILGEDWKPLPVQGQTPTQVLGDIGNLLLGTSGGMVAGPRQVLGAGPTLPAPNPESVFAKLTALKAEAPSPPTLKPSGVNWAQEGDVLAGFQKELDDLTTGWPKTPQSVQLNTDIPKVASGPTTEQLLAKQELLQSGFAVEHIDEMHPDLWPGVVQELKQVMKPQKPQLSGTDEIMLETAKNAINEGWPLHKGEVDLLAQHNPELLGQAKEQGLIWTFDDTGMPMNGPAPKKPAQPAPSKYNLEQKPWTATDELKSQGWTDVELKGYSPQEHADLVFNLYGKTLKPAEVPKGQQAPKGWEAAGEDAFGPLQVEQLLEDYAPSRPKRFEYEDKFIGPPAPKREELPMDTASRLQRAADMGFDLETPYYSGAPISTSKGQIKGWQDPLSQGKGMYNSEAGIFLSDDPHIASNYYTGSHGAVQPVYLRAENPREVNWTEMFGDPKYQGSMMKKLINESRAKGHDVLHIKDMSDVGGLQNQTVLLEPNRARSPFARFDPKNIDANDLIASLAAALGLPGAATMLMPPEAKK